MDIIAGPRNLNPELIGDGELRMNQEVIERKIPLPYYKAYCRYSAVASKRHQGRSYEDLTQPANYRSQLVTMSFWEKRAFDLATFFFVMLTVIYLVGGLSMCAIRSKMATLSSSKLFRDHISNSKETVPKTDTDL